MKETIEGKFVYDKDTPKKKRFAILTMSGIEGAIYVPKHIPIPQTIILKKEGEEEKS